MAPINIKIEWQTIINDCKCDQNTASALESEKRTWLKRSEKCGNNIKINMKKFSLKTVYRQTEALFNAALVAR